MNSERTCSPLLQYLSATGPCALLRWERAFAIGIVSGWRGMLWGLRPRALRWLGVAPCRLYCEGQLFFSLEVWKPSGYCWYTATGAASISARRSEVIRCSPSMNFS